MFRRNTATIPKVLAISSIAVLLASPTLADTAETSECHKYLALLELGKQKLADARAKRALETAHIQVLSRIGPAKEFEDRATDSRVMGSEQESAERFEMAMKIIRFALYPVWVPEFSNCNDPGDMGGHLLYALSIQSETKSKDRSAKYFPALLEIYENEYRISKESSNHRWSLTNLLCYAGLLDLHGQKGRAWALYDYVSKSSDSAKVLRFEIESFARHRAWRKLLQLETTLEEKKDQAAANALLKAYAAANRSEDVMRAYHRMEGWMRPDEHQMIAIIDAAKESERNFVRTQLFRHLFGSLNVARALERRKWYAEALSICEKEPLTEGLSQEAIELAHKNFDAALYLLEARIYCKMGDPAKGKEMFAHACDYVEQKSNSISSLSQATHWKKTIDQIISSASKLDGDSEWSKQIESNFQKKRAEILKSEGEFECKKLAKDLQSTAEALLKSSLVTDAEQLLIAAISIQKEYGVSKELGEVLESLASVEVSLKNERNAEKHFKESIEALEQAGEKKLADGVRNRRDRVLGKTPP